MNGTPGQMTQWTRTYSLMLCAARLERYEQLGVDAHVARDGQEDGQTKLKPSPLLHQLHRQRLAADSAGVG